MILFSLSDCLRAEVLETARKVEHELSEVKFNRYLVLTNYGKRIVLIFDLMDGKINLKTELGLIEEKIRKIAGANFGVRMTDEVYENSGLIEGSFPQSVIRVNNYIDDSVLDDDVNHYSKYIKSDITAIKKHLNLRENQIIWQLNPSNREDITAVLSIVNHKKDKKFRTVREEIVKIEDKKYIILHFDDDTRFKAINKIYILAEKNRSSLIYELIKYIT
ncbi:hypothetical protein [Clostridium manihotivorum]|uniref:Uncharacterized protein n=1 Tax=Clostridium manihotivorum TaxID=2320868 RepID=A0A410DNR4_9CLOT|nr:hypothetical protein [Clostridium manihotivorum]QAA30715.1 hypothetical protein C1I91_02980 [Clostridium manihotivorum]